MTLKHIEEFSEYFDKSVNDIYTILENIESKLEGELLESLLTPDEIERIHLIKDDDEIGEDTQFLIDTIEKLYFKFAAREMSEVLK